jgi:hypothetical protein
MSATFDPSQLTRWRLILGKDSQECLSQMCAGGMGLSGEQQEMDEALAAIYDETEGEGDSRWLGTKTIEMARGYSQLL